MFVPETMNLTPPAMPPTSTACNKQRLVVSNDIEIIKLQRNLVSLFFVWEIQLRDDDFCDVFCSLGH